MGVASTPPPPQLSSFPRKSLSNRRQIPMSQGFHQAGNIFSFSDEFERPQQQNHVAQQSRRDKLRVQGSFEAAVAAGHPLLPIEDEDDEAGIYGPPPAANNNMLSEMFNFAGPGPGAGAHVLAGQSSNPPAAGYHRLINHRPDFYGANRQGLVMSNATANNNWSSILEDPAAVSAKQHGMSPADSSSTAMRLFFMNPTSAAAAPPDVPQAMQHYQRSTSPDPHDQPPMGPAAVASSTLRHRHHHNHDHHSGRQGAFLGAAGSSFGEAVSFGGGVMESQAGPSLSLSSSTLQQLEMRKAEELIRFRSQGSAAAFFYNSQQQEQQPPPPPSSLHSQGHQSQVHQQVHMTSYGSMGTANVLRNSKYARAAQELLEEFCSVGRGHVRGNRTGRNSSNPNLSHGGGVASTSAAAAAAASSSSSKDMPPLSPADRFENQRKKSKLLSMLDEVERRYNHYSEQMQMVVNSFDSVMAFGAATPYTALAQKAMSRHFRCLKDAIAAQLKQTCELLGDKDGGSGSGITKGETPKLRLIDQSLRQQRAFHQMGMMEQEAWRPQRGLPDRSVTILRAWLFEHFLHPYPSDADKHLLARQTGLSRNQVSNWFINARVRLWKPMVEDMYQQEAKEDDDSQLKEDEQTNNTHRILLSAATTQPQQQQLQASPPHSPESDSPRTVSITRPQLDHYDHLRLAAPIVTQTQPPPPHDTAAPLIVFPPGLDDEMYRRAAAAAAARTGDLSLTLGLRHAGGNAPDTGRFGL